MFEHSMISSVYNSLFFLILKRSEKRCFQGVVYEFWVPEREDPTLEQFQHAWRFGNGMFGIVLTFGLLWTAMKSRRARSCRFASGSPDIAWCRVVRLLSSNFWTCSSFLCLFYYVIDLPWESSSQVLSEDSLQTTVFLSWSYCGLSFRMHSVHLFLREFLDACLVQTHGLLRQPGTGQSSL